MARCRCTDACGCAVKAGPGVAISGTGDPSQPWVISAAGMGEGVREIWSPNNPGPGPEGEIMFRWIQYPDSVLGVGGGRFDDPTAIYDTTKFS